MAKSNPTILIAGAGPTGLTAAVEFARNGIAARIIDRDDAPTPLSKAVGISPHSLDILEPSGATERLLEMGIKIRRAHIWSNGSELGQLQLSVLKHRFNFLLSLPQSETETILAEILGKSGIAVERKTELNTLRQSDAGIDVTLEGPDGMETSRFDYVYGADGAHSAVRGAVGIAVEGHTHKRQWSIADAELPGWPYDPEAAHLFLHDGGDVGFIIPIGKDRYRAVSNTKDALARIPGAEQPANVFRKDVFHIPVKQGKTYQSGNVFLGGDAAHTHSPVGARGMNLGIEDAVSFVRRFVEGDLDGYTGERWPIGKRWIGLSETILARVQDERAVPKMLRNVVLRIVGHVPLLQRPALNRMAGLQE